jgi:hypothetical protein
MLLRKLPLCGAAAGAAGVGPTCLDGLAGEADGELGAE